MFVYIFYVFIIIFIITFLDIIIFIGTLFIFIINFIHIIISFNITFITNYSLKNSNKLIDFLLFLKLQFI